MYLPHQPHKKQPLYCWNMFTEWLHSNGRCTDRIDNLSRDSHIANLLAHWLLPNNEL
jgi:hypothetical protein